MALPVPANTTCDIYRNGRNPPAVPDVAGVPCFVQMDYARRMETGESLANNYRYTHTMLVDLGVDVRDGFLWGSGSLNTTQDFVWVPSQNGTKFAVIFVEKKSGAGAPYKKVYLDRAAVAWPSSNL